MTGHAFQRIPADPCGSLSSLSSSAQPNNQTLWASQAQVRASDLNFSVFPSSLQPFTLFFQDIPTQSSWDLLAWPIRIIRFHRFSSPSWASFGPSPQSIWGTIVSFPHQCEANIAPLQFLQYIVSPSLFSQGLFFSLPALDLMERSLADNFPHSELALTLVILTTFPAPLVSLSSVAHAQPSSIHIFFHALPDFYYQ